MVNITSFHLSHYVWRYLHFLKVFITTIKSSTAIRAAFSLKFGDKRYFVSATVCSMYYHNKLQVHWLLIAFTTSLNWQWMSASCCQQWRYSYNIVYRQYKMFTIWVEASIISCYLFGWFPRTEYLFCVQVIVLAQTSNNILKYIEILSLPIQINCYLTWAFMEFYVI